jgi:hypothetical protein
VSAQETLLVMRTIWSSSMTALYWLVLQAETDSIIFCGALAANPLQSDSQ